MKRLVSTFCLLIIVCMAPAGHAHRFYASFTQIDVRTKKATLEIIHRIFTHDVEDMLEDKLGNISSLSDAEIEKHLRAHVEKEFSVYNSADQKLSLEWVGYDYKVDEVLVYQQVHFTDANTKISVTNHILMDTFEQQKNTVNVQKGNIVKTVIFRQGSDKKTIKL